MRALRNLALLSVFVAASLSATAAGKKTVSYRVATLGLHPNSISNAGFATGSASAGHGDIRHAFLYSGGPLVDLGALGPGNSVGYSLNELGQVAGSSELADGTSHAFRYSKGVMSDLGTLGYGNSVGYGINNHGHVVGASFSSDYSSVHAFLYANGGMTDLGTLEGETGSSASAINDAGQIAGFSGRHAFLYANGMMKDIGTLGGWGSRATGINELGQVIGQSITGAGEFRGFIFSGGVMTDLGQPPGNFGITSATGINNAGAVVGNYSNRMTPRAGFVWQDGQMRDLNDLVDPASGWTINDALDINDHGQIAAYGCKAGACGGLLLTPMPEPDAWLMFFVGLALVGAAHRRAPNGRFAIDNPSTHCELSCR